MQPLLSHKSMNQSIHQFQSQSVAKYTRATKWWSLSPSKKSSQHQKRSYKNLNQRGQLVTFAGTGDDSGNPQITAPLMESMKTKICQALESETVTVTDINGDGQHVSIYAVSQSFDGKNSVQRQRMVYKAIWEELQSAVHAVDSMVTLTPDEAA